MAQTLWIGNIHFKTTNVPVKLLTAVSQNRIQLHLFHKTDGIKLRQQMICAYEKTPVSSDQQLKGFRVGERSYIPISPEELAQTEPKPSRTIAVHEFVKTDAIDPVFMGQTYRLEPAAPGKVYGLLAAALKETGRQGLCTWTMRKRAHLGALRSDGKSLNLIVLRFADEIIRAKSLGLESFSISEKELNIAGELIGKLTVPFQPEKYTDEHQKKLRALIGKKARGEKIRLSKPKHLTATVPSKLLEVLEESLQKAAA
ncbi:MAG: Ku protein [Candidatus Margulisiibacteriota bacterium]|jgi:DNA end-binding protein Ku